MPTSTANHESQSPPSGTVTFLFTDIEGSTRLLERLREQYAVVLADQRDLLREAFAHCSGHEIDTQGDSFFVAFPRATDALACVVEAQRALASHVWPHGAAVRVRMGLHTGEPIVARTGYIGMDVNRAARIAAAGHGGQVLLSQTTRDLVYQDLPPGTALRPLGEHYLKDIRFPQPIFQLDIDGLPVDFPSLKTLAAADPPPTPGEPPYQGLQFFAEADAPHFFGRDEWIRRLAALVCGERFLAVVGASGSGKSSLVRAGLVPTLRRGRLRDDQPIACPDIRWQVQVLTPTAHPLEALATSLTRGQESVTAAAALLDDLARDPRSLHLFVHRLLRLEEHGAHASDRLLLVLDQFEELFTLCRAEAERRAFLDNLLTAAQADRGGVSLVLTLRADFYEHLAPYPDLSQLVAQHQLYLSAMSAAELREAIQAPAALGGWTFSPGLVDLMLHDVGADDGRQPEPGALPLLSHALLETWKRRRGNLMNLRAYSESGGIRGAIAQTAEGVFHEQLDPAQQAIARGIFLRLTELGEGTQDTRRRASLSELLPQGDPRQVEEVLARLADARLITTAESTVEVAHEALIREWPTLRQWLAEDREGLRMHRHLTESAEAWERLNRDAGELYRGARLAQVLEWTETHRDQLNTLERDFMAASEAVAQQEAAEREAQQRRELEAAQRLAETQARAARQLRRRALYLAGVLVVALLAAGAAGVFGQRASQSAALANQNLSTAQAAQVIAQDEASARGTQQSIAQDEASARGTQQSIAQDEAAGHATQQSVAEANFARAEAQRLAAAANALVQAGGSSELIALLAVRSLNLRYTAQADEALTAASTLNYPLQSFVRHTAGLTDVDISLDNLNIVTASADHTARVWDAVTGVERVQLTGHSAAVTSAVFSPDVRTIATASKDGTVRLWDAQTGSELRTLVGHTGQVNAIAFWAGGEYLLSGGNDGTARLWEVKSGQQIASLGNGSGAILSVAFAQDSGHTSGIVTGNLGDYIPTDPYFVVTGGTDNLARVWEPFQETLLLTLTGHLASVTAVAVSADNEFVLTGSADKTARLWDADTGEEIREFAGHTAAILDARFSREGDNDFKSTFAFTGSEDRTARMWDVRTGEELQRYTGQTAAITGVAFRQTDDADLTPTLATASADGTVYWWGLSPASGAHTVSGETVQLLDVAFSPDGRYIATAGMNGLARLWDARSGVRLRALAGHMAEVRSIAFSPDNNLLLTASRDGTARLWEVASSKLVGQFAEPTGQPLTGAAFSPDGSFVVTTGDDMAARLWDVETGELRQTYQGHAAGLNNVAFSPDGHWLATAGADATARLWQVDTGLLLHTLAGDTGPVTSVAFSPDGRLLATASADHTARLWDVDTGQEVVRLSGHSAQVWAIAFSPDGRTVATASGDGTARVWDAATGQEVRRFSAGGVGLEGVAFAPDGSRVATVSDDGVMQEWDADYLTTLAALCSRLLRDFTAEERAQYGITDTTPTCPEQ